MNIDEVKQIEDFRLFMIAVWKHLNLPSPTPMQIHIADYLMESQKRKILQALRGIGKTWLTGAYVCWRLLRNPNEKILIVSQTGGHADNIAIFIRRLINTMPILQHLQPDKAQGHRSSIIAFDVNGCEIAVQPSVKSLGITSQLQGNRASLLIADDVEGMQNSATEMMRAKLLDAVAEFDAILQTTPNSQILCLGTPQSSESIYNKMRDKGYYTQIYPARYPEDTSVYNGCLAPYIQDAIFKDRGIVGQPIDTRFTDADLIERELSYGKSGFRLQYMLDTTLSDAERYPLKLKDFIVMALDKKEAPISISYSLNKQDILNDIPNLGFTGDYLTKASTYSSETMPYESIIMSIDPSGRGNDATSYAIVASLNGRLFILDVGSVSGGYDDESLALLANKAKEFNVNKIYLESNFGDGLFTTVFKPFLYAIYNCTVEEIRSNGQKELRIIDTLEPVLNQHRLILSHSVATNDVNKALADTKRLPYSLLFQLTHITKDRGSLRHDDAVDALAMAVEQFKFSLLRNPKDMLEEIEKKKFKDSLDHFVKLAKSQQIGSKTNPILKQYKSFSNTVK